MNEVINFYCKTALVRRSLAESDSGRRLRGFFTIVARRGDVTLTAAIFALEFCASSRKSFQANFARETILQYNTTGKNDRRGGTDGHKSRVWRTPAVRTTTSATRRPASSKRTFIFNKCNVLRVRTGPARTELTTRLRRRTSAHQIAYDRNVKDELIKYKYSENRRRPRNRDRGGRKERTIIILFVRTPYCRIAEVTSDNS